IKSDTPLSRIATRLALVRLENTGFHWRLVVAYPLPSDYTAMNRKLFWLFTAILLVSIHRAEAQQPGKIPRIGFLLSAGEFPSQAFRQALRNFGYVEGKNVA